MYNNYTMSNVEMHVPTPLLSRVPPNGSRLFTIMYADDTSVQLSGDDLDSLIRSLNVELQLLSTWLKANKLSLNTQKTWPPSKIMPLRITYLIVCIT